MSRIRLLLVAGLLAAIAAAGGAGVADAAVDPAWVQRTLAFEYRLANKVALRNAPWIGTRDSLGQRLTLTQQLELGVRSLELDVHYLATPRVGGGKAVVACAATCDDAPLLETPLDALRRWLRAHRDIVVLLVVDDHLGDGEGHEAAARVFAAELGRRVYAPPAGGGCAPMPLGFTRKHVREAGAQVVVVSGCGPDGTAWRGVAFDDAELVTDQRDAAGFRPYPRCDGDRSPAYYEARFIRYVEGARRLTRATARAMVRCGVDAVALAGLERDDARLEAFTWSWAPGEPVLRPGGACAVQGADGRWRTEDCRHERAFACRRPDGSWALDRRRAAFRRGLHRCRGAAAFDLPRSGREAQRLRTVMRKARVRRTWVAYRR